MSVNVVSIWLVGIFLLVCLPQNLIPSAERPAETSDVDVVEVVIWVSPVLLHIVDLELAVWWNPRKTFH